MLSRMITIMTKKNTGGKPSYFNFKHILILLLITIGVIFFSCQSKNRYRVTTFRTENGFGYQIEGKKKVFIRQPFIPAITGDHSFKTAEEAFRTGSLVLNKLKDKKNPAISVQELDSLKISYPRIK